VGIVVAFDNPNAESDLAVYRSRFGLPACTTANGCFRKVNHLGAAAPLPKPDARWAAEASLDLQMVSATCPKCKIVLVEAASDYAKDLFVSVAAAVALGARIVSNSYGSPEYPEQIADGAMLNHPGIALTVASGDGGYGLSFPASSPYVTAVGGTSLTPATNQRGWTETAWAGAGSGCSKYEKKPDHQTDSGCSMRTVADIAAVADPDTGVAVYNSYQASGWQVLGGTSAAAPIIAGAYALAGGPAPGSGANGYPYRSPAALFDVSSGTNGRCDWQYLCAAGPGYDGPTGLGTPNGLTALRAPGASGRAEGVVTDANSSRPVMGARVSVGNASTMSGLTGRFSLELPVGVHEMTITAPGYRTRSVADLTVAAGEVATVAIALDNLPEVRVAGVVWDGSGHSWSLYAQVIVEDVGVSAFTDPITGYYSMELTSGTSYTLRVIPRVAGYQQSRVTIRVGESDLTVDIGLKVDQENCVAQGYRARSGGDCVPVEGGIVVGNVRDQATGAGVNGAIVFSPERPEERGMSIPTPDDPALDDGFFWLFSTLDGDHVFRAVRSGYVDHLCDVTVVAEMSVSASFALVAR
jgi:hypothetical protein